MKKSLVIVLVCLIISAVWVFAAWRVIYDTLHLIEIGEYVMPATKGVRPTFDLDGAEFISDLKARAVEAEAGNQSIEGRRLVYAVITNRENSEQFPDTTEAVLYQKNQFQCVTNGSINRVTISEETKKAIRLEMERSINTEVLYFTAGKYNDYCIPMFKVGDHFFWR